jgi:hypothetical protein
VICAKYQSIGSCTARCPFSHCKPSRMSLSDKALADEAFKKTYDHNKREMPYVFTQELTELERISELRANIDCGNHKSANDAPEEVI